MKRRDLVEATVRRNKHSDNPWGDLPDPTGEFLPDEPTDDWRAAANDLRDRVARLENQVMQQYTAMAAYATIAQKNIEAMQSETRSDLDRSQSTTIGLIERVRRETNEQVQALRTREAALPGGLDSAASERLQILEPWRSRSSAASRTSACWPNNSPHCSTSGCSAKAGSSPAAPPQTCRCGNPSPHLYRGRHVGRSAPCSSRAHRQCAPA